jgi:hypothetical protein
MLRWKLTRPGVADALSEWGFGFGLFAESRSRAVVATARIAFIASALYFER